MYIVNAKRIATMRLRLGEASDLIDDDRFLPMYRKRQKDHPEEFAYSVKLAKRKKNPNRYFAYIWSGSRLERTLEWLTNLLRRFESWLAEKRIALAEQRREQKFKQEYNPEGRAKILKLYDKTRLFSLKN